MSVRRSHIRRLRAAHAGHGMRACGPGEAHCFDSAQKLCARSNAPSRDRTCEGPSRHVVATGCNLAALLTRRTALQTWRAQGTGP